VFYYSELNYTFSLLGSLYVTTATEPALLLADSDSAVEVEWFDFYFKFQDLELNLQLLYTEGNLGGF
jgi:hypothetical protein